MLPDIPVKDIEDETTPTNSVSSVGSSSYLEISTPMNFNLQDKPEESKNDPDETQVNPDETQVNPDETPVNPDETQVDLDETQVNPDKAQVDPDETPVDPDQIPDDVQANPDVRKDGVESEKPKKSKKVQIH
jgi:hypothetical protein